MRQAIIICLLYAVSDYLIVKYYRRIGSGNKLAAAFWSAAIVALTLFSVRIVIESWLMIPPACVGAALGTAAGMSKFKGMGGR